MTTEQAVSDAIKELSNSLGLPKGLLAKIQKADDWSYIIQLHALIESTLNWSLLKHLEPHNMSDHIMRLPLSGRTGKVAIGISFGILEKTDERFLDLLSSIRNRVVHNVRNIDFNLVHYLQNLPAKQKAHMLSKACAYFEPREKETDALFFEKPRAFLWLLSMQLLTIIFLSTKAVDLERETKVKQQELLTQELAHSKKALKPLLPDAATGSSIVSAELSKVIALATSLGKK